MTKQAVQRLEIIVTANEDEIDVSYIMNPQSNFVDQTNEFAKRAHLVAVKVCDVVYQWCKSNMEKK